jgi:hypothetical protein
MKTQKHECQDQIEPLQEWVAEVITQAKGDKKKIAQNQAECVGLLRNEVVVQVVGTIKDKTMHAVTKVS